MGKYFSHKRQNRYILQLRSPLNYPLNQDYVEFSVMLQYSWTPLNGHPGHPRYNR